MVPLVHNEIICYLFPYNGLQYIYVSCISWYWGWFFNWYSGGWSPNWVHSALRPTIGLSCQSLVIMMMEKLVEWWLTGKTEVLRENLPQCHFVHHKRHMLPGREPGQPRWKPETNRVSYATAMVVTVSRNLLVCLKLINFGNNMLNFRFALQWSLKVTAYYCWCSFPKKSRIF
jgi:hypothetical protein